MNAIRIRLALIGLVCAGVFKISASHIIEVAMRYGNSRSDAMVYPIAIDAVILIAALVLTAARGVSKMAKWYARLARWFGFGATIFCNLTASNYTSAIACVVNLIPAISLILTVEMMIHAAQGTTRNRPARKAP